MKNTTTTAGELRAKLDKIKGFDFPLTALTMKRDSNPVNVRACVALMQAYPKGISTKDMPRAVEIVIKTLEGAV